MKLFVPCKHLYLQIVHITSVALCNMTLLCRMARSLPSQNWMSCWHQTVTVKKSPTLFCSCLPTKSNTWLVKAETRSSTFSGKLSAEYRFVPFASIICACYDTEQARTHQSVPSATAREHWLPGRPDHCTTYNAFSLNAVLADDCLSFHWLSACQFKS